MIGLISGVLTFIPFGVKLLLGFVDPQPTFSRFMGDTAKAELIGDAGFGETKRKEMR